MPSYTTKKESNGSDVILVKQDDEFYKKLMSKELTNAPTPSFRIYYGVAPGDVPFLWESTPGTPKHVYQHHNIPPLTPPPSHASPAGSDLALVTKKPPKPSFLGFVSLSLKTLRRFALVGCGSAEGRIGRDQC